MAVKLDVVAGLAAEVEAGAAAFRAEDSSAKLNFGLAVAPPACKVASAFCFAACTRCNARRSAASRWSFSLFAKASVAKGGVREVITRAGAGCEGAVTVGFTAAVGALVGVIATGLGLARGAMGADLAGAWGTGLYVAALSTPAAA